MTDNAYRIDGVAVSGGFLDGFDTRFSASLNCVIGARGTGKTSLVEFIRYALRLEPRDEAVRRRFDAFIELVRQSDKDMDADGNQWRDHVL